MKLTSFYQAEQADKANQTRAKWLFCALSKRKLQEPIVSCALGKLYNKDAIIEFLLDRSTYGDGENICGHVRSLKVRFFYSAFSMQWT